jgi:hypothetical protein
MGTSEQLPMTRRRYRSLTSAAEDGARTAGTTSALPPPRGRPDGHLRTSCRSPRRAAGPPSDRPAARHALTRAPPVPTCLVSGRRR